jgi:hypothetical protein
MKSLLPLQLIVLSVLLGIASTSRAQQVPAAPPPEVVTMGPTAIGVPTTVVPPSASDEAAPTENSPPLPLLALNTPPATLAALSFSNSVPAAEPPTTSAPSLSSPAASAASGYPDPAPSPQYRYTERDYRLEIALGVAIVRFRSNVYFATGVGTHTAVAYFLKDWLAVEGAVTTAFAPSVFAGENIKYLGYGAGPKFSLGRSRFEPWFHVLGGGMHIVPQTALSGKNGFEVTAGGGVDYGLSARLALRVEADYLRSHVFGEWQNSAQATAALVVHF